MDLSALRLFSLLLGLIVLAPGALFAQAFDPGALAAPLSSLAPERWYWGAYSPDRSKEIWVGPYQTLAGCRDMLGSATGAHPFLCHLWPNARNCRNISNGFAYPAGWPYPVPADRMMVSLDCAQLSHDPSARRLGWYFLSGADSSDVELKICRYGNYVRARRAAFAPHASAWIANYSDMRCPGAPCFSVGVDTACE